MIAHSSRFEAKMRSSHKIAVRALVCRPGQAGSNPDGTEIPIESGAVSFDSSADVRGGLDLTTLYEWPRRPDDLLSVYGNEVYVQRGITYADGSLELLGLGYFRIGTVEQEDSDRGAIRITASDRMSGLVDARLLRPRQFDKGATFGEVVQTLVQEVYPSALIEWDSGEDKKLGRQNITDNDRFKFLHDLVTSHGKVWYWDNAGVLQIRNPPDPSDPVATIGAGPGGVLVSSTRQITRDGVYNAVLATGEGADTKSPPHAVAYDLNPRSPTYFNGTFGQVPRFYSSPFITTVQQAGSAARAMLAKNLGAPYNVSFDAVPNPALEVLDPIRLVFSYDSAPETHVVDTLTVPLTARDAIRATTREQTEVRIAVD